MFQAAIYSPSSSAHPSFPHTLYSCALRWIVIMGRTADESGDENMRENDKERTMDLDMASVLDWLCLLRLWVCHLMAIFNASFLADWVNSCLEEETALLMKAQLNQQQRAGDDWQLKTDDGNYNKFYISIDEDMSAKTQINIRWQKLALYWDYLQFTWIHGYKLWLSFTLLLSVFLPVSLSFLFIHLIIPSIIHLAPTSSLYECLFICLFNQLSLLFEHTFCDLGFLFL